MPIALNLLGLRRTNPLGQHVASVLYLVGGLAFRVAWIETGKATLSWCPDELTTVRITSAP